MNISYYNKYLKYKNKYLAKKNNIIKGGTGAGSEGLYRLGSYTEKIDDSPEDDDGPVPVNDNSLTSEQSQF